ncbi:copper resistance protein CopC [Fictibacillus iocasae]|uniref:Copper resistance protein CopC n=1 Tax=Fictibacillus iocasae TaxID=2715437 RepID=A0ABW2NQN0_9BACL
MKKWMTALLIVVMVMISPQKSFAHSGLEKSEPAADSTVTDNMVKFKLTFNTEIEDLSRIRVTDDKGVEVSLMQMGTKANELVGESETPMPNGTYNVYWKIIGEDSHVVQGSYKFTVKAEETVEQQPPAAEEKKAEKTVKSDERAENKNTGLVLSPFFYAFLALAALAVLLGLILGKRRKK